LSCSCATLKDGGHTAEPTLGRWHGCVAIVSFVSIVAMVARHASYCTLLGLAKALCFAHCVCICTSCTLLTPTMPSPSDSICSTYKKHFSAIKCAEYRWIRMSQCGTLQIASCRRDA